MLSKLGVNLENLHLGNVRYNGNLGSHNMKHYKLTQIGINQRNLSKTYVLGCNENLSSHNLKRYDLAQIEITQKESTKKPNTANCKNKQWHFAF